MFKILHYLRDIWNSKTLKQKIIYTLILLAIYRLLVVLPVPFIDIDLFMSQISSNLTWWDSTEWLSFFAMLLWGTLENFSIIAVWLIPYINASIIMQLMTAVLPQLEELQEQWEIWTMKIQQYTRWFTLPLAFVQSFWMIYFMNYMFGWASWWWVIDTNSMSVLLLSAFTLTVWTVILMWIGEILTEKGTSNGISLIIFSSIVAWITSQVFSYSSFGWENMLEILVFMTVLVLALVIMAVLLIKTRKEIPIRYARQWKIEETAVLPIPLNPVWMIPIIFSIAFISFPYLISQVLSKVNPSWAMVNVAKWIETNLNIYTNQPSLLTIASYFILIVLFTFFYTLIVFNPDKIADNIQKRWWFIHGIRPWEETSKYLNRIYMHLCLWWWMWLWLIWIYSYIIAYIPFIQQATMSLWAIPIVVSGSWVIIIVWVVQDLLNKFNAELVMERYDRI